MIDAGSYPMEKFIGKTIIVDKQWYVDKNNFVLPKNYYNYIDKIIFTVFISILFLITHQKIMIKYIHILKSPFFIIILEGLISL